MSQVSAPSAAELAASSDGEAGNSEPAVLVVCHEVMTGKAHEYEQWLRRIRAECGGFEGHLGAEVIRPSQGSHVYTVVVRFSSIDKLNCWLNSRERKEAIADVEHILASGDCPRVHPGFDVWFTPNAGAIRVPKKHKQYMVTVAVVFPLTIVIPAILQHLATAFGMTLAVLPLKLLTALILVALLVWVIFPYVTARLWHWLTE